MKNFQVLAMVSTLACFPGAQAQSLIKSVDEKGQVTYSDKPVQGAVSATVVPIQPGPDEERIKAARERAERISEQADKAAAERQALEDEREAAREAAREKKAATPEIIIKEEGGYPAYYRNPPLITPNPPGTGPGKPDHPVYKPRPPVTTPVLRPRPTPR